MAGRWVQVCDEIVSFTVMQLVSVAHSMQSNLNFIPHVTFTMLPPSFHIRLYNTIASYFSLHHRCCDHVLLYATSSRLHVVKLSHLRYQRHQWHLCMLLTQLHAQLDVCESLIVQIPGSRLRGRACIFLHTQLHVAGSISANKLNLLCSILSIPHTFTLGQPQMTSSMYVRKTN